MLVIQVEIKANCAALKPGMCANLDLPLHLEQQHQLWYEELFS